MKYKIILSLFITVLLTGCEFLDYTEHTFYDDPENIFTNFGRTRNFLTGIYTNLPDDFNSVGGAMRSAACDEAEFVIQSSAIQEFNNGQWSSSNALDNNWFKYYSGIRAANFFLNNIEGRTFEDFKYNVEYDDEMERFDMFQYEARFLRAFFYFELAKRYGDIPMPQGVINDVEEINRIEKSDFEDVIVYIVEECDAIRDYLPVDWNNFVFRETGRVTRGAVQALKVRALLYAASPLHNPENDKSKWVSAAEAANEFLTNTAFNYSFDPEYYNSNNMSRGAFNNRGSKELIFERRQGNSFSFERANFPKGFDEANGNATCPSQNLVDAYQTTDGYDVVLDGNGQWSAPGSTVFNPMNPYDMRDPRLLQTVLVNGKKWKGTTVETFNGGAHGFPLADATPTGYYLQKYVRQDVDIAGSNAAPKEHVWVLFRLAEIYLNLAEAMNEAFGPNELPDGYIMDAVAALNVVRTRAAVKMPQISNVTTDELRSLIINERRVELAFEDHRFWDIRRWRLHDSDNPNKISEDIYGVVITKNDDIFNYSEKLVDNRIWDDKMYLYPIPYNEININPNLTQNPGW